MDILVKAFKALSNPNRLRIFEMLKDNALLCACTPDAADGETPCCVDNIVQAFKMSQSTISQHLKELHTAGLLRSEKQAQWVYYTVDEEKLQEIRKYSQILIITHNRRSMEIVDSLYGVTMEKAGISKMVSVDLQSRNMD